MTAARADLCNGWTDVRVRVEIMGLAIIRTDWDLLTILHFCHPVISIRTRSWAGGVGLGCPSWRVVVARSTLDQHHQALLRAFQRLLVEDRGGDHRAARQSFHRGRAKLAVRGV
jgi:hypothetical protein